MKHVKVYFVHLGSRSIARAAADPSMFKGRSLCHYLYDEYVGGNKTWDDVKKKANQMFARFIQGNKTYLVMFSKDPIKISKTDYAMPQTPTQLEILKQLKRKRVLKYITSKIWYNFNDWVLYPMGLAFLFAATAYLQHKKEKPPKFGEPAFWSWEF
jgi:hypothetical protein